MRSTSYVHTKYPSLTKEDCVLMLQNLEESLGVFERKNVVLTASELRVKSLLTALRTELLQHLDVLREDGWLEGRGEFSRA